MPKVGFFQVPKNSVRLGLRGFGGVRLGLRGLGLGLGGYVKGGDDKVGRGEIERQVVDPFFLDFIHFFQFFHFFQPLGIQKKPRQHV